MIPTTIEIQSNQFLSALLPWIEQGQELILTHSQQPIAHLVPLTASPTARVQRRLGEAKGLVEIAPDFDELPAEWMAYFQ
jgi:antitoxin (DNA-binding transcriptional repressor) of toxin-antitoxin stability system